MHIHWYYYYYYYYHHHHQNCRSQRPRGRRRGSAAARMLGFWVRIPPGARLSVSCECCVLSGIISLCVWLITRPEESYRVWCVCDREASIMRRPWPTRCCFAMGEKIIIIIFIIVTVNNVCVWYTIFIHLICRIKLLDSHHCYVCNC